MNRLIFTMWVAFLTFLMVAGFRAIDIANLEKVEASTMQEQMTEARDYSAMYEAQKWLSERGISVPDDIRLECESAGIRYGVCPELLMALAWKESRFTPTVKNGSCVGLMQINITSHSKKLAVYGMDNYSIHAQIYTAAELIADLAQSYAIEGEEADAGTILAAYHGENHPAERLPSAYTEEVLQVSSALERAHGK